MNQLLSFARICPALFVFCDSDCVTVKNDRYLLEAEHITLVHDVIDLTSSSDCFIRLEEYCINTKILIRERSK